MTFAQSLGEKISMEATVRDNQARIVKDTISKFITMPCGDNSVVNLLRLKGSLRLSFVSPGHGRRRRV
jgi:hypothetical protein